jgi:hypothetical protein
MSVDYFAEQTEPFWMQDIRIPQRIIEDFRVVLWAAASRDATMHSSGSNLSGLDSRMNSQMLD